MRKVFTFIVILLLYSAGFPQDIANQIKLTYGQMSVLFHQKNAEGVMVFVADNYQSDLGWNRPVFKHVLTQLFSVYSVFDMTYELTNMTISSTQKDATAQWRGVWNAKSNVYGDNRSRFPYFGSSYIRADGQWVQIHTWKKFGTRWKLTNVRTVNTSKEPFSRNEIQRVVDSFYHDTGKLGVEFGRNILNSVDTNGILLVEGESPSAALVYLKEKLHERPDVTVYDNGFWYGDFPGNENIQKVPLEMKPQIKEQNVIHFLRECDRPVYSTLEKVYMDKNNFTGGNRPAFYSIPQGMVFAILPVSTTYHNPSSYNQFISSTSHNVMQKLTNLDIYAQPTNNYVQRELISNYHFSMARNYLKENKKDMAHSELLKASQSGYDIEGMNLNVGAVLLQISNESTEAINILTQETKYNPWVSQPYFLLGKLQKQNGMIKGAIFNYEKGLLFNSEYSDAYLALGQLYAQIKNYPYAKAAYKKFLGYAPYHRDAYLELGKIYDDVGQYELALKHYQVYLKIPTQSSNSNTEEIEKRVKELESKLKKK